MNIYQEIWNADMNGNGIRPILPGEYRDSTAGYIVVDSENSPILKEVHIPDEKRSSYQMVEKLFDNFTLNQMSKENNTRHELKEVEQFLTTAIETVPCMIAKTFIEETTHQLFSEQQWYTCLYDLWFRQFNWDSGHDLSGFEHVFIGEQKANKLVGHHFWYKYWLEYNNGLSEEEKVERLRYLEPYVVTINYYLKAFDYKKRKSIRISKKRCAFLAGLSAEGLLALGTVRAMAAAPDDFDINGQTIKLQVIMSPDSRSIRTFFPC